MEEIDKINQIIEKSGHDLNFKVKEVLEKDGWKVDLSPHYVDIASKKTRELDIIAKKKFILKDGFGQNLGDLQFRLFVECKYINETTVIWFDNKKFEEAKKLAMDNPVLRGKEEAYLEDTSILPHKKHHYLKNNEVAKLVAKGGQSDSIYEGQSSCLNAIIYYGKHFQDEHYTIDFPVMIVNSYKNLHKRNPDGEELSSPISENFELEVDYSYPESENHFIRKNFLLDIVSLDDLKNFLDYLSKNDLPLFKNVLDWDLHRQRMPRQRHNEDFGIYGGGY